MIPASLKILKVLIEELLSASGLPAREGDPSAAAAAAGTAQFDDDDDDDGWEDDTDVLDLGLGSNKSALMGYLSGDGQLPRERDDETQNYLTEFFVRAARENIAGFSDWYNMLSDFEKQKLNECANAAAPP
jgi:importin-9